jgi:hypothetical protein
MDVKEIVTAWASSFNPTPQEKELADKRTSICETCPSMKKIFNQKWSAFCGECGCPIGKKVYTKSNNPCPLKKWSEVDGDLYLPKSEKTLI